MVLPAAPKMMTQAMTTTTLIQRRIIHRNMSNLIKPSNIDPMNTYLEELELELQKIWDNSNDKNIEGEIMTNNIVHSSRRRNKKKSYVREILFIIMN